LIFTADEVCWECNEIIRTETYADEDVPKSTKRSPRDRFVEGELRKTWKTVSGQTSSSRFQMWRDVLCRYSDKLMSKPSDKLVAVADT
jgi:hypothetical protein